MNIIRPVSVLSMAAALAAASPVYAQPTPPDTPRFEVGIDAAVAGPDGGFDERARAILAPRLTTHLTSRTALSVSGDLFTTRRTIGESWADSRVLMAEMQRALVRTRRVSMVGVVGGGMGWTRTFQPEYSYLVWNEPVVVPASTRVDSAPEFTLGLGVEQRIAPRLALRQDIRAVIGEVSEFRATLGVVVPIGRYPERFAPLLTRSGERPDSLRNGTTIGAAIGAAAMATFVGFLGNLLCEGDCDDLSGPIALGAGYGAGIGALGGAIIDSFRE